MFKILFVHNQLVCGGAEQALFDLITLLDKTKFDITVLVQYDGGIWEQKFRDAGIDVISIWDCQKASINPLVKLRNLRKRKQIDKALHRGGEGLLKACLDDTFDIIVAFNGSTLQRMHFSGNAKTVKYIHGDVATNPLFLQNTVAQLDILKRFDRIICVSNIAKRSFMEATGITENVFAHHNPVNSHNILLLSQTEVSLPQGLPIVCAVGRLAEEKGFERLIRIHKKLVDDGILHKLVIVGDGPELQRLTDVIREIHADDSVIMVGYQENPYPYMKQSDILVCPSYTEGLGLVALEAILLGTPVISSAPSVGELFGNENCGLITGVDDKSLEAGIRRMLTDRALYQAAKAGAERRSAFFEGKRMVQEIEAEFISLVEK